MILSCAASEKLRLMSFGHHEGLLSWRDYDSIDDPETTKRWNSDRRFPSRQDVHLSNTNLRIKRLRTLILEAAEERECISRIDSIQAEFSTILCRARWRAKGYDGIACRRPDLRLQIRIWTHHETSPIDFPSWRLESVNRKLQILWTRNHSRRRFYNQSNLQGHDRETWKDQVQDTSQERLFCKWRRESTTEKCCRKSSMDCQTGKTRPFLQSVELGICQSSRWRSQGTFQPRNYLQKWRYWLEDLCHCHSIGRIKEQRRRKDKERTQEVQEPESKHGHLANPDFLDKEGSTFHVLSWQSTIIRRICRNTLQAETYGVNFASGEGIRMRAVLAEVHDKLPNLRNWEERTRSFKQHIWITYCKSLEEHLKSDAINKVYDKRLSIDIQALTQLIWENAEGEEQDELNYQFPDLIQWVDTSKMLVDALTRHEWKRTPRNLERRTLEYYPNSRSANHEDEETEVPPRESRREKTCRRTHERRGRWTQLIHKTRITGVKSSWLLISCLVYLMH